MTVFGRVRRLFASTEELESESLHRRAEQTGADAVRDARDRQWVSIRGVIDVVALRPRQGRPWLEAELTDGTARVTLVWMGRDRIPGIEPGRELTAEGRISCVSGSKRMYNPLYQLR